METNTVKAPKRKANHRHNGKHAHPRPVQRKAGFWQFPWHYKQTATFTGLLLFVGLFMEIVTEGRGLEPPVWPFNFIIIVVFAGTLALMAAIAHRNPVIHWLSSIPSAICAVALMGILSLVAGTLPQDPEYGGQVIRYLGLNHLFTSWPFTLSILFVLTNLGIAALRRLYSFHREDLRFVLNHTGLWIVIAAGTIGVGDMQRLNIYVNEGESAHNAFTRSRQAVNLPFQVTLNDFRMEVYAPKMAFVNPNDGELLDEGPNGHVEVAKGAALKMAGWQVQVLDFLPNAKLNGDTYEAYSEVGAAPAALVRTTNIYTKDSSTGWISCGSNFAKPRYMQVGHAVLAMTKPRPKKFQSAVTLNESGKTRDELLEVNKPISIAGWRLYQLSYDDRYGQWSKLSIIEAIRDPWLPVVYFGIGLLLLGTLQILWSGTKVKGVKA